VPGAGCNPFRAEFRPFTMTTPRQLPAGSVVGGALVLAALLAGCAATTVPGTAGPASGAPTSVPYRSSCAGSLDATRAPVTTPTGSPLITITHGTNAWIANERTEPYAIAVYEDGTAIRSEDVGTSNEPLAALTIGRIDPCRLADAVTEITALAETDIGSPGVTDQGTTSLVLRTASRDVRVDAYALGIGDELLPKPQRDARERLTALIGTLRDAMTGTAPWRPDRLRVSTYGTPADVADAANWPLGGGVQRVLDRDDHTCGVLSGEQARTVLTALGSRVAVGPWTDGQQTLVLAIGPLVPGQEGCAG
jgi:hypothetical protein